MGFDKDAATPTATAARASTGTNSRSPPDDVPVPTGLLHRMRRRRKSPARQYA